MKGRGEVGREAKKSVELNKKIKLKSKKKPCTFIYYYFIIFN